MIASPDFLTREHRALALYIRSRALESLRCYHAIAYLATCTMAGAAAESVVLVVGAAKLGADEIQKRYRITKERTKLVDAICANVQGAVRQQFIAYMDVLKYWRDDASHASAAAIGELEAMASLLYLANLARLIDDRWSDIVGLQPNTALQQPPQTR